MRFQVLRGGYKQQRGNQGKREIERRIKQRREEKLAREALLIESLERG